VVGAKDSQSLVHAELILSPVLVAHLRPIAVLVTMQKLSGILSGLAQAFDCSWCGVGLSDRSGLAYANCWKIWNGKQTRIDLTTIDRLCEALECKPGDFLVYVKVRRIPSKK
jgi:DNA-binding Xre family transcriptional regulator